MGRVTFKTEPVQSWSKSQQNKESGAKLWAKPLKLIMSGKNIHLREELEDSKTQYETEIRPRPSLPVSAFILTRCERLVVLEAWI